MRSRSAFPDVYCSVGTHPHHADEEDGIPASELIELTKHPKVVALGEAGLDYFYEHGSREAQERGFRAHIAAARETGLAAGHPHQEADEDCGRILEDEVAKGAFKAVLHCYTGGRELAMKAIALGLSISFTGILTFKKSDALRALATLVGRLARTAWSTDKRITKSSASAWRNEPPASAYRSPVQPPRPAASPLEISAHHQFPLLAASSVCQKFSVGMCGYLQMTGPGSQAPPSECGRGPRLIWGARDPNESQGTAESGCPSQ